MNGFLRKSTAPDFNALARTVGSSWAVMKINDQTGCLVENIRAEEILSRRENFSSVADGLDKSSESVADRLVVVHYRYDDMR